MNVNFAQEKMEVFSQGWRFMRDNFYDEKFHGADWNAIRQTYEPLVAGARTGDEMRRIMSLMVGELNASHLGVNAPNNPATQPVQVGKLGLRFDRNEYETNERLRITVQRRILNRTRSFLPIRRKFFIWKTDASVLSVSINAKFARLL